MSNYPWSPRDGSYKKTMQYLHGRLTGQITSVKTPWSKLNQVGADGWEVHTSICFASRPGGGKSVLLEEFCRKVHILNPDKKIRVLKLQLEMLSQVVDIREFSSHLGKSYGYVVNAEEEREMDSRGYPNGKSKISMEELKSCWEYVQTKTKKQWEDVIEVAPTVEELSTIIDQYMEAFKTEDGYITTILGIDHARLIRRRGGQGEGEMLTDLCIMLNSKKKQYPLIIVMLTHLNRTINGDARCEPGKYGNYIRDEDILASDSVMQNFDMVIGMDRPSLRQLSRYGPSQFIIEDPYVLVFHYLKVRNGVPGLSFFRGEFSKMQIVEVDAPPKATASRASSPAKIPPKPDYRDQNQDELPY